MEIHAAMVDRMDQNIGRLIRRLKETDKFENTLIFFLLIMEPVTKDLKGSKNENAKWGSVGSFEAIGQSWANAINSPFRKWKVQGMEGGICTPLIAHWPNGIKLSKNSISREPCHLIDFVPTFIELAGNKDVYPKVLPKMNGVSLVPTFLGNRLMKKDPLFFQYGSWQVLRHNEWKLVQRKKESWQLYDLSKDRTETEDLASESPEG